MTKADACKFRAEKCGIINRLLATIDTVRAADYPAALAELLAQNLDGERDRATNLTAKLAGAVLDYMHSR